MQFRETISRLLVNASPNIKTKLFNFLGKAIFPTLIAVTALAISGSAATFSVIGLSKLNRLVEHFGRRGAIQEQLTVAIHNAVDKICEGNLGVAVCISATHNCVSCRGVKHQGASMQTAKLSGAFLNEDSAKAEFYKNIELASICQH